MPLMKRDLPATSTGGGLPEVDPSPVSRRPPSRDLFSRVGGLLAALRTLASRNLGWVLSTALHATLLTIIAFIVLHGRAGGDKSLGIEAAIGDGLGEQSFENLTGGDQLQLPGAERLTNPAEAMAALGGGFNDFASDPAGDLSGLGPGGKGIGGGSGDGEGDGSGGGGGPGLGAGFFGSKGEGRTFVFVVDMSGSMYGQRFERAKAELIRSINKLKPEQKFYVFFFNDRTYPMFEPRPAKDLVPANPGNKQKAARWIRSRAASSTTNPNMAIQQALEMKPDVIFLLTDGELDDPGLVRSMIRERNSTGVTIHTIAFENPEGGESLKAIAEDNKGTYRFVK
jgi:hypothetical protein